MDLTQEQFEENLMAMPEEDKLSVLTVMEQSEPEGLVNFAEALGVNLIMEGEEPVAEEPVAEEVAPEEPVLEEVAPEEPIDPAAIAAIEGVPPAEPASVLPPPAAPEPVPERPIDQEMQALAEGGDIQAPAEIPEEVPAEIPIESDTQKLVGRINSAEGEAHASLATGTADLVSSVGKENDMIMTAAGLRRYGLVDFEERVLAPAIIRAQKDGIDIKMTDIIKPTKQLGGDIPYAVSNGELRIPEVLVGYIGSSLLDKINKDAEIETQKQIAEQEQEQKPAEKTIPVRA